MVIWQGYIRAVEIKRRNVYLEADWYRFLQNPDLSCQTKLFCWFKLELKSCSFLESNSAVLKVILILGCDTCFSLSHRSSYFREELSNLSLSMNKISYGISYHILQDFIYIVYLVIWSLWIFSFIYVYTFFLEWQSRFALIQSSLASLLFSARFWWFLLTVSKLYFLYI